MALFRLFCQGFKVEGRYIVSKDIRKKFYFRYVAGIRAEYLNVYFSMSTAFNLGENGVYVASVARIIFLIRWVYKYDHISYLQLNA